MGALSAGVIAVLLLIAVLAPLLTPYSPAEIDSKSVLTSPGRAHLFGTDNLGRDVFSRVVYGARHSLYVGLASVPWAPSAVVWWASSADIEAAAPTPSLSAWWTR